MERPPSITYSIHAELDPRGFRQKEAMGVGENGWPKSKIRKW
jgi:hypothetical protein